MSHLLDEIQAAERAVRHDGQREYAREAGNAFANFDRVADDLGLTREKVCYIYFRKHVDGIVSHLNGHTSQREDIRGRLKDARMYLALLWGMFNAAESAPKQRRPLPKCQHDVPPEWRVPHGSFKGSDARLIATSTGESIADHPPYPLDVSVEEMVEAAEKYRGRGPASSLEAIMQGADDGDGVGL